MISLHQVSKKYETPAGIFSALTNIDLEIRSGEFVGVVGKSGSGKSTLLNLVAGIDRPTSGAVTIAGTPIHEFTENQLAAWRGRNVGFVFQFFQLLPTLTAAENVMLPMDFGKSFPLRERRTRAQELLERVGVGSHADKLPATLSGGEQQRVAIARATAPRPKLLLADEPTGNLDATTGAAIIDLLFDRASAAGAGLLVITHDRAIAARAGRVLKMVDGRVTE